MSFFFFPTLSEIESHQMVPSRETCFGFSGHQGQKEGCQSDCIQYFSWEIMRLGSETEGGSGRSDEISEQF